MDRVPDPIQQARRLTGTGIAINLCAAAMHLFRSAGMYFGDARPILSRAFERKAGLVHAFALLVLFLSQHQIGSVT